jgi:hypothetical protein
MPVPRPSGRSPELIPGTDLIAPAARYFTPALAGRDSFGYLTCRPAGIGDAGGVSELGVHGYGPDGSGPAGSPAT